MTRRCSHCSNNGHNSRTCPSRGGGGGASCYSPGGCVRIFGVRLTDGSIIKKSASTSNLSSHLHSSLHSALPSPTGGGSPLAAPANHHHHHRRELGVQVADGYLSDGPAHASNRRGERKKGVPWTEEEHRLFLIGLQKLGKGDWRGIARNYVTSRTPTQVASHAQKYFIRQSNAGRRKRRTSLFDMAPEMAAGRPSAVHETPLPPPMVGDADHPDTIPSLDLSLATDFKPMETSPLETVKEADETAIASVDVSSVVPTFFPAYIPVPFSVWPSLVTSFEDSNCAEASHHHVLKPVPLLPKEPVHVDELVSMSQLSLVENGSGCWDSSPVSLKLLGEPSRQSAFHSNAPVAASNLSKGKNSLIQAV